MTTNVATIPQPSITGCHGGALRHGARTRSSRRSERR